MTVLDGASSASWVAMAKDWAQWAVVSTSALYALWLGSFARTQPLRLKFPAAAVVGSALGGLTIATLTGLPVTWLTRGHYDPGYDGGRGFSARALLADATPWTLAGLCACVAVWLTGWWLCRRRSPGIGIGRSPVNPRRRQSVTDAAARRRSSGTPFVRGRGENSRGGNSRATAAGGRASAGAAGADRALGD